MTPVWFDLTFGENWMLHANCHGIPTDMFYLEAHGRQEYATEKQVKRICDRCTVQNECLDYSLRTKEQHGIWGGLNASERARLRKREGTK